jgi:hypothetical protein
MINDAISSSVGYSAEASVVFLYGVLLLQGGVRWVGSHADLELYI